MFDFYSFVERKCRGLILNEQFYFLREDIPGIFLRISFL